MGLVKVQGDRNWRAECTHTTMARVLDVDGSIGCSRCGVSETLRWVYVCTEDEHRTLSDEFIRGLAAPVSSSPSTATSTLPDEPLLPLNEWVSRAIDRGHYTEEEARTLRAQRAAVLESVRMESTRHDEEKEQAQAAAETLRRSLGMSTPGIQGDDITAAQAATTTPSEYPPTPLPPPPGYLPEADTAAIPPCNTSYCHYCRPSSCERSWQSLTRLCRIHNLVLKDTRSGKPVTSIFDIPMCEIRRPLPRRVTGDVPRDVTDKNTDPTSLPSVEDPAREVLVDLQKSLDSERPKHKQPSEELEAKEDYSGEQDRPRKRPRLTRRSKFTTEQLLRSSELIDCTNLGSPESLKSPAEDKMEIDETEAGENGEAEEKLDEMND